MSYYRRAKVTIDCFVFQGRLPVAYLSLNGDPQTQFGALGNVPDGIPDCVTIEYLPEPVVFNDGDAVWSTIDAGTRVRIASKWVRRATAPPPSWATSFTPTPSTTAACSASAPR